MPATRFRFGPFLISPAHRSFQRDETDVPLIPRYFDLLVLLVTHRNRVVTRQEIFDVVWADVIVSDGALSQAVRTIRRCLDDDPREPRFIRTVSRHGYQFVGLDVFEEADEGPLLTKVAVEPLPPPPAAIDPMLALVDRLLRRHPFEHATDEERRDAAEQLHQLGTAAALAHLDGQPGHAEARAILRDARWDVPHAGAVGLLDSTQPAASVAHLVRLRLRRAARASSNRTSVAAAGGAIAGVLAGCLGGVALWLVPDSDADPSVVVALAAVGALAGAIGAGGIGAGLAAAEALARSARRVSLIACGAAGGALAGFGAHILARALLTGMFGRDVPATGGWFEGLALGAAAGLGYGLATAPLPGGGLAAPRGTARLRASLATGLACGVVAVLLALDDGHLVASSLDAMASAFQGSHVGLAPLARVFGEGELRPVTRTLVSGFEGVMFGAGLAFGLTHRPRR